MMSPLMLVLWLPVIVGAGALFVGLALAAAAAVVSESFEERWTSAPPVERVSIPFVTPDRSSPKAA